jgi:IS30 family transposase
MPHVQRRGLTADEEAGLWARWKRGESQSAIARAVGRSHSRVFQILVGRGGIAPPPRQRAPEQLQLTEREEISRQLVSGATFAAIGRRLRRDKSTISREVGRNGGREHYRAMAGEQRAWQEGARPKRCRLARNGRLRRVVAQKLARDWSPEQIAGWLKVTYAKQPAMQVSHETIYQSLFIQGRGLLKKQLQRHLRRRRIMRRARQATHAGERRGDIVDAVSIRERPAAVEDRAVPGHWEGDLIAGAGNSHVATLVERQSRYVVLVRVPGKDTAQVIRALTRQVLTLPQGLMASLTWDRGKELAAHKTFTVATDVQVYFCDPHSPWQRGSNENTNGLLRQYFPKGTDLSDFSQGQLNRIAHRLNTRPRKTLGFATPAAKLAAIVAATG